LKTSAEKKRLIGLERRIAKLTAEFHTNLAKAKNIMWFDKSDVEGIPEDLLQEFEIETKVVKHNNEVRH